MQTDDLKSPNLSWKLRAEHHDGRNVGHRCIEGAYTDPTDRWSGLVIARTQEDAVRKGRAILEKRVKTWQPCRCVRKRAPGQESWWNSVRISAEPQS